MSFTRIQDFKSEIVTAELKKIVPHDLYGDFIDLLATVNYMLPSNGIMTEQALALSLLMHPIVVIHSRKSKDPFYCVGGIRSLMLAKASQITDAILPVTLVGLQGIGEIELAVNADVLLSPLMMSIRRPAAIGAIHQKMNKDKIETLLIKGMRNKTSFAEQTGYAKNTIFPPKSDKYSDSGNAS